jgi:hypothetical protein
MRGAARQFTHSKVMVWLAFDRAIRSIERFGRSGPLSRGRRLRTGIHREICERPSIRRAVPSCRATAPRRSMPRRCCFPMSL